MKPLQVKFDGYLQSLSHSLYQLQQEGELCDLILKSSENQDFPAHRCVVSAVSPFIAEILRSVDGQTLTANGGQVSCFAVPLENVGTDVLSGIVEFMYTGKLQINPEDLQILHQAGTNLQMQDLISACNNAETLLKDEEEIEITKEHRRSSRVKKEKKFTDFVSETPTKKSKPAADICDPKILKTEVSVVESQINVHSEDLNGTENNVLKVESPDIAERVMKENMTIGTSTSEFENILPEESQITNETIKLLVSNDTNIDTQQQSETEDSMHDTLQDEESLIIDNNKNNLSEKNEETENTLNVQEFHSWVDEDSGPGKDDNEGDVDTTSTPVKHSMKKPKKKFDPRVLALIRKSGKTKLEKKVRISAKNTVLDEAVSGEQEHLTNKRKRTMMSDDEDAKTKKKRDIKEEDSHQDDEIQAESTSKSDKENGGSVYRFQCGECHRKFTERSHLIKHMNFTHPVLDDEGKEEDLTVIPVERQELTEARLKCPVCPRKFDRRSNWVQHLNFTHRIKLELNSKKKNQADDNTEHSSQELDPAHSEEFAKDSESEHNKIETDDNTELTILYRKDIKPHLFPKPYTIQPDRPKVPRERINKKCPVCLKFFRFKLQYDDHVLKHNNPKPYKCEDCMAAFKNRGQLKAHQETHGTGEMKFQCVGCERAFSSKSRLLLHEKKHFKRERSYICDTCGKGFMEEAVLNMHIKHVHNKQYVQCEMCKKKISKNRYKEHLNLHTAEKVYPCDRCEAEYKQKKSLECHLKFKHGVGLDLNEENRCTICQQIFSNAVTLEKHMIRHTGKKSFMCSKCELGFYTKAERNNHELTHLTREERPWPCPVCFKAFVKESNLKSHLLVHNPSKPLSCSYCGKGFRWKNKLKEHVRIHTGEKPHKCRFCDKWFADCAIRRYHEKKFHPEEPRVRGGKTKFHVSETPSSDSRQVLITRGSGQQMQIIVATQEEFEQRLDFTEGDEREEISLSAAEEAGINLEAAHQQSIIGVSTVPVNTSSNYLFSKDNTAVHQQDHERTVYLADTSEGTQKYILALTQAFPGPETATPSDEVDTSTKYILTDSVTDDTTKYLINGEPLTDTYIQHHHQQDDDKLVISGAEGVVSSEGVIGEGGGITDSGVQMALVDDEDDQGGEYVQYILQGEEGQQIQYLVQHGQQTRL